MLGPASSLPPKPQLSPPIGEWSIEGIHMRCLCPDCGLERPISTATLIDKLGPDRIITEADLPSLAPRFRCEGCKAKGRASLRIVMG